MIVKMKKSKLYYLILIIIFLKYRTLTKKAEKPQFKTDLSASAAMVSEQEIVRELRHKYLVLLKAQYETNFNNGLCSPDAFVFLQLSCDIGLDNDDLPMKDFEEFMEVGTTPPDVMDNMQRWATSGITSSFWKDALVNEIVIGYDAIINFIDAHNLALKSFNNIKQSQDIKSIITTESFRNKLKMENYHNYIE